MTPHTKRMTVLHAAYTKAQAARGDIPKNVSEMQTLPDAAVKGQKKKFKKLSGKPARGPSVIDAGLMRSSSSGSAIGPTYMM